jgi:hypothetical protein
LMLNAGGDEGSVADMAAEVLKKRKNKKEK